MKKLLIILFLLMSLIGYAQDVDIQKIKQKPIQNDSVLNMLVENYALSEKMIEKGAYFDKADIYFVCSIPMQKDTMSVYVFTMPTCATVIDWAVLIKRKNTLSFYSYDINLYKLIYDLSSIAATESPMVSSDIIHLAYEILSYCSDYYEIKYETSGNNIYGYFIASWARIIKKEDFTFHNQYYYKEKEKFVPTKILNLQVMKKKSLFHSSINNWLKKTYGASDIKYKLYKVVDVSSCKSIYLLETEYFQRKKFDFIFQANDTFSFYFIDRLFVPLAFKIKDFVGEEEQDKLWKALRCLCLCY